MLTDLPMYSDIKVYNLTEGINDLVYDPSLFQDVRTGTYYVALTGVRYAAADTGVIFLRCSLGEQSGP